MLHYDGGSILSEKLAASRDICGHHHSTCLSNTGHNIHEEDFYVDESLLEMDIGEEDTPLPQQKEEEDHETFLEPFPHF